MFRSVDFVCCCSISLRFYPCFTWFQIPMAYQTLSLAFQNQTKNPCKHLKLKGKRQITYSLTKILDRPSSTRAPQGTAAWSQVPPNRNCKRGHESLANGGHLCLRFWRRAKPNGEHWQKHSKKNTQILAFHIF